MVDVNRFVCQVLQVPLPRANVLLALIKHLTTNVSQVSTQTGKCWVNCDPELLKPIVTVQNHMCCHETITWLLTLFYCLTWLFCLYFPVVHKQWLSNLFIHNLKSFKCSTVYKKIFKSHKNCHITYYQHRYYKTSIVEYKDNPERQYVYNISSSSYSKSKYFNTMVYPCSIYN